MSTKKYSKSFGCEPRVFCTGFPILSNEERFHLWLKILDIKCKIETTYKVYNSTPSKKFTRNATSTNCINNQGEPQSDIEKINVDANVDPSPSKSVTQLTASIEMETDIS